MNLERFIRIPFLLLGVVLSAQGAHAYTFSVLYTFQGGTDAAFPYQKVALDKSGNLYGIAGADPACNQRHNCSTVYEVAPDGTEKVLAVFNSPKTGLLVESNVVQDELGNVYGATATGGKSGCPGKVHCGLVFALTPGRTTLHYFRKLDHGYHPSGRLVRDTAGNLYGATDNGGRYDAGVVFKIAPDGTETILHAFERSDGADPIGGVNRDSAGNLYGTTFAGGGGVCSGGCGTVFEVTAAGTSKILHSFAGGNDGGNPEATVALDSAGNLYGTSVSGGAYGYGTVFKVTPAGVETVLHSFANGSDGANPAYQLIVDSSGDLLGTTSSGGLTGCGGGSCGTVFSIAQDGTYTTVYDFTGGADGGNPEGPLSQDAAGILYGTAVTGGSGYGTVFKLRP